MATKTETPLVNRGRMRRIYTTGQVAKICRVSPRTVASWYDRKNLAGYSIPGSNDRRFTHDSLLAFMRGHNFPLYNLDGESEYRIMAVGMPLADVREFRRALAANRAMVVSSVADPVEIGSALHTLAPDAVLMDFAYGNIAATVVVKAIAKLEPATCIIGLVGADYGDAKYMALTENGFHDAFRKPVAMHTLAEAFAGRADLKWNGPAEKTARGAGNHTAESDEPDESEGDE